MKTPISVPSPFRLFPMEDYSQVTSKWIDPDQAGYDQPMMDVAIQKRYLEKLWQRLYGSASPWDEDYVKDILQEDIGACQEKALLRFSNDDKSRQDKWHGMNFRPYASTWIKRIRDNIPLYELQKPIFHAAHRAITIQNLAVRILPSQDICLRSIIPGHGYPFDRLQASAVLIGTPVYRIAQTKDKIWSLVIMPDFIAWVLSSGLAYADDIFIQKWKETAQNQLAAIIQTQTPLVDTNGRLITQAYIGSVFPASTQEHDTRLILSVPIANEEGKACSADVAVFSTQATCIPMQTSRKNFAKLIDTLKERCFGWCGTSFYNDCSAELKSLFLPFGIWLPRHSSDQVEVSEKIDMNDATPEERLTYLKDYGDPFLTIVYIGGHVFLYIGHCLSHSKETSIAMTYQNLWGMADLSGDSVSIIGQSVFFPLLRNYPEDPNLRSLLQRPFFQITHLKRLTEGYPQLKKPYVVV